MEFKKQNIIESLHSIINIDGGVSWKKDSVSESLTTSQFIVLCHRVPDLRVEFKKILNNTFEFILSNQCEDGHWERQIDTWHTSITAWSLRALLYQNSLKSDPRFIKGLNWLFKRQDSSGGFYEAEKIKTMNTYSTSTSCYVLNLLQYNIKVKQALHWLESVQQTDGGFKDYCAIQKESEPSLSSYVVHGIETINLSIADKIKKKVVDYLKKSQRISGAWSAWYEDTDSIEGTVAALKALLLYKKDESFIKGLEFIKRELPNRKIENWELISLAELYPLAS